MPVVCATATSLLIKNIYDSDESRILPSAALITFEVTQIQSQNVIVCLPTKDYCYVTLRDNTREFLSCEHYCAEAENKVR